MEKEIQFCWWKGWMLGKASIHANLHWLLPSRVWMLQPLVSSQRNSDQSSAISTMARKPWGIVRKVERNKCRAPAVHLSEAKEDKKFPKGWVCLYGDRSSRTNKYSDPKAPSLGPWQKQMGGGRLLYTFSAAYFPFLKIYSGYSLQCCRENLWPHGPSLPSNNKGHSETAKCVSKPWKAQTCSSKPPKKPFLSWVEAVGAWNFWNKPIPSPLLPKCVLLEGRDRSSLSFQLLRDTHSNIFEVTGTRKPNFILDWFFSVDGNVHLIVFLLFDLSISFG